MFQIMTLIKGFDSFIQQVLLTAEENNTTVYSDFCFAYIFFPLPMLAG